LDRQLAEAFELVSAFDNAQARSFLQEAKRHRDQAAARIQNNMPVLARVDIRAAFALIEQAVKVAMSAPLQRMRSHLEELMRRAEHEVIGSGNREAERLLQRAKRVQADAELALRALLARKAVEGFRLATSLAQNALELVKGRQPHSGPEAVENARQQLEVLKTRAREAVETSQNANAKAIYNQAANQALSAETSLRNGNPAMALQLYQGATRLFLRAIDLAGGNTESALGQLQNEHALLRELVASAESDLSKRGDSRAIMLINRARLLLDEARQALDRKSGKEAEWRLTLARNFVTKAMRAEAPGGAVFESRLEEELAQLLEDSKEIDQRALEQRNDEVRDLTALARGAAGRIERALALGRQRLALQGLLAAQRFLAIAETMLGKSSRQEINRDEVARTLDQLDAALQEASESAAAANNTMAMEMMEQVREIRDRAREAFAGGRLRVAGESADVAMEMLRTAQRVNTLQDKTQNE
jgi:tetratricopeptide (TPR) repeat protein